MMKPHTEKICIPFITINVTQYACWIFISTFFHAVVYLMWPSLFFVSTDYFLFLNTEVNKFYCLLTLISTVISSDLLMLDVCCSIYYPLEYLPFSWILVVLVGQRLIFLLLLISFLWILLLYDLVTY